jgi:hypothetical protein
VAASGREEAMMWAVERPDGGRGFGFTGGHFHVNWSEENFRRVILNALLWISKVDVPAGGVQSARVMDEELIENLDPKKGERPTVKSLAIHAEAGSQAVCGCTPLPRDQAEALLALTTGVPARLQR